MITKDDLNDALDAWIIEERERLGGRPTHEEIVAFLRDELPPAEAARVQALLAYDPELTPFLKERSDKQRAIGKQARLRRYAGATTLVIAVLSVTVLYERRRSIEPSVFTSRHELHALDVRGPAEALAYEMRGGQERYLLTVVPTAAPSAATYDIEITRDSRVVWRRGDVRPIGDVFLVDVPGKFLRPGAYALNVRADGRLVDRYPFRVSE